MEAFCARMVLDLCNFYQVNQLVHLAGTSNKRPVAPATHPWVFPSELFCVLLCLLNSVAKQDVLVRNSCRENQTNQDVKNVLGRVGLLF